MNWRNDLDPDFQERIKGLEECGCEFYWRKSFENVAQASPCSAAPYIFEIWRYGQLLDFIYPVQHPFDLPSLIGVEKLIMREWKYHFFTN
ncbi:hypothetical protein [Deinococcus altitudinis]|uniref:hypothetical protein n=1 Tax=Deinococcus altitudinis TaxID=468914 RepID=UPI0038917F82